MIQNFYHNRNSVLASFSVGTICGITNFLFSETVDKIHSLAESNFSKNPKDLSTIVTFEMFEEVLYRMIIHPFTVNSVIYCLPSLARSHLFDIRLANLVSSVGIGILLGSISYFQNNDKYVAISETIRNSIYGIINDRFGPLTSIIANTIKNYLLADLLRQRHDISHLVN